MSNKEVCQFQVTNGKKVYLDDYVGKWLVLYFYPKDATPGCTIEGHVDEVLSALKDLTRSS